MTRVHQMSPRGVILLACILSLAFHVFFFYGLQLMRVDYGKPIVDPIQPRRFHLERAKIDAKYEKIAQLPPAQRHIELDPTKIAAFSGPLATPSIPTPRIQSDIPLPLGMESSAPAVRAASALPLEAQGNVKQLAQALANNASAEALQQMNKEIFHLAGGSAQQTVLGSGDVPKFDDISSLMKKLRQPNTLNRPAFQPILLRLSNDVLFQFDSAIVQPSAIPLLEQVAQFLKGAVRSKITIEGHTDTFGADEYNQRLSEQRAQSIANWLRTQTGIQNLATRGYGKTRPIVNPNGTIEEQSPNRRVEIRIEAEK